MKEAALVRNLMKKIKAMPCCFRVRKLADRFTRGLPDIQAFFCWDNELLVVEIECKAPGGKLSALQKQERDRMTALCAACNAGKYLWIEGRDMTTVHTELSRLNLNMGDWE